MKCDQCGKKIGWFERLIDKISPHRIAYTLAVIDDDGTKRKAKPVCGKCGEFYAVVERLVKAVGEKEAMKILTELQEKGEEDGM